MDPTVSLLLVLRNLLVTMGALTGTPVPGFGPGEYR